MWIKHISKKRRKASREVDRHKGEAKEIPHIFKSLKLKLKSWNKEVFETVIKKIICALNNNSSNNNKALNEEHRFWNDTLCNWENIQTNTKMFPSKIIRNQIERLLGHLANKSRHA